MMDFNGGAELFGLAVVLVELFKVERRLGRGDQILNNIQKHCPLFNGGEIEKEKEKS